MRLQQRLAGPEADFLIRSLRRVVHAVQSGRFDAQGRSRWKHWTCAIESGPRWSQQCCCQTVLRENPILLLTVPSLVVAVEGSWKADCIDHAVVPGALDGLYAPLVPLVHG